MLSPHKAKEMLHDGTAHGKPLTKKQRNLFGLVASGKKPTKKKKGRKYGSVVYA